MKVKWTDVMVESNELMLNPMNIKDDDKFTPIEIFDSLHLKYTENGYYYQAECSLDYSQPFFF